MKQRGGKIRLEFRCKISGIFQQKNRLKSFRKIRQKFPPENSSEILTEISARNFFATLGMGRVFYGGGLDLGEGFLLTISLLLSDHLPGERYLRKAKFVTNAVVSRQGGRGDGGSPPMLCVGRCQNSRRVGLPVFQF